MNTARGGKGTSLSWNTRRLSKDKLLEYLDETRLIDEIGCAKSAGSLEDTVRAARRKVVAACGHLMPRRRHGRTGDSMYWWNDQLSVLRRECLTAQRRFTRSKGDPLLHEAWKKAKSGQTGLKFRRGPARRTLHSRRTKESGWEAQGKCSPGGQRGAKKRSSKR